MAAEEDGRSDGDGGALGKSEDGTCDKSRIVTSCKVAVGILELHRDAVEGDEATTTRILKAALRKIQTSDEDGG